MLPVLWFFTFFEASFFFFFMWVSAKASILVAFTVWKAFPCGKKNWWTFQKLGKAEVSTVQASASSLSKSAMSSKSACEKKWSKERTRWNMPNLLCSGRRWSLSTGSEAALGVFFKKKKLAKYKEPKGQVEGGKANLGGSVSEKILNCKSWLF